MTTDEIINEILKEVDRAENKHPDWPMDKIHAAAIVCEESGELIRCAVQYELENGSNLSELKKEAIQTAATCIRLLKKLYD